MSQATTQVQALDLRKSFPRSPNTLVGNYVVLGRIIDKCRATIAGTHGEYNFNCPLDQRFFEFVGVDAEAFKAELAQGKSDEAILAWINGKTKRTEAEILEWSYEARTRRPEDAESKAFFEGLRRQVAPKYNAVETWFQLLDAEEGRL